MRTLNAAEKCRISPTNTRQTAWRERGGQIHLVRGYKIASPCEPMYLERD